MQASPGRILEPSEPGVCLATGTLGRVIQRVLRASSGSPPSVAQVPAGIPASTHPAKVACSAAVGEGFPAGGMGAVASAMRTTAR